MITLIAAFILLIVIGIIIIITHIKNKIMNNERTFFSKYGLILKATFILIIVLLLLIPASMIRSLISERQGRQNDAIVEVSSKWAGRQTVTGPIITIPYYALVKEQSSNTYETIIKYATILPDKLTINATMYPEKRYRGIYEVVVYGSKINFEGSFDQLNFNDLNIAEEDIIWNKITVSVGINDMRGIEDQIPLLWNNKSVFFNPGSDCKDIFSSGISASTDITKDGLNKNFTFNFNISLKGSELLYFVPVGKETKVSIASKYSNPSFDGAFLPNKRDISPNGFSASWKILNLNRNYPQSWKENSYDLNSSAFGVNLIVPVDQYQKSERTVKYAIMIIALTFLVFFFVELINKKMVHPFQYILIGLALCIFYTLLISISEQLNFDMAYLISSIMTTSLIGLYTKSILKSNKLTLFLTALLVLLYGYIYILIQLQDYALLMGSLGLFIILATVMYYSRKIDWYQVDEAKKTE